MKRFWIAAMLAVSAVAPAWGQPLALYENDGIIDTTQPSPQINALAFVNRGSFSVTANPFITTFPYTFQGYDPAISVIPYDFQNVLNYTNEGTMNGFTGFRFDTVTESGQRLPANSIDNTTGSTVTGQTYVLLSATNIANQGILSTTADGLIQILATNPAGTGMLDLSHGGLEIQPFTVPQGFCQPEVPGFDTSSNFFPEAGILDALWSLNTNSPYLVTTLYRTNSDGTVVISSPPITLPPPQFGTFQLILPNARPFVYTNQVSSTQTVIEAVFVQDLDTNITSRVRFASSPQIGTPGRTAAVAMTTVATNIVTGQTINYAVYLLDSLLSTTNYTLLTNVFALTERPAQLKVVRTTPCEYTQGGPSNAMLDPTLFYAPPVTTGITNLINTNPPPNLNPTNIISINQTNTSFATNAVTNYNASYVAQVTETPGTVPGNTATNQPGRIEIFADNLNLDHARIRGESAVSIHTKNLEANTDSFIDVQTLNYELGSAAGKLVVRNLVPSTTRVFNGFVEAWSGVWTNFLNITNNVITPDTNVPPNLVTNTTSTTVELDYMILLVFDAMSTTVPVTVNDFATHSTNLLFYDNLTVNGTLDVDSASFTITNGGALRLSGNGSLNWDTTTFPNLMYLTNQGSITIPNLATLGSPSRPYASVDNEGSFSSYTLSLWANQLVDGGLFSANAALKINAGTASLEGGRLSAGSDIFLNGGYVKMRNFNISCQTLTLSVTNGLTDSGGGASNLIQCADGFSLLVKPPVGDLFGTTIRSPLPAGGSVNYIWPANDRGPVTAGFSNNVVIGKLILTADANSVLNFSGTGVSNAIYVDYLELDGAMTNNLDAALNINTNLVIYFADSSLGGDYFLTHTNVAGGRLKWVSSFSGPNSSIAVYMPSTGQTVSMNRSLRYSKILDSDGDGIPNFYDPTPLDVNDAVTTSPISLTGVLNLQPAPAVLLSWVGSTGTVFEVDYTTNLAPASWQPLAIYTNSAPGFGSFQDTNAAVGPSSRYYRVKLVR